MEGQPIQLETTVELSSTKKRTGRMAQLAVRFCPVKLRAPSRLKNQDSFQVYAVYATEIHPPEGEDPVSWMLLTTEERDHRRGSNTYFALVHLSLASGRLSPNSQVRMSCRKLSLKRQ